MSDDFRRAYRVLYDFQASDSNELTVKSGDLVISPDAGSGNQDWMYVYKCFVPSLRGHVPASYLQKLTPEEAMASISAANPSATSRPSPQQESPKVQQQKQIQSQQHLAHSHSSFAPAPAQPQAQSQQYQQQQQQQQPQQQYQQQQPQQPSYSASASSGFSPSFASSAPSSASSGPRVPQAFDDAYSAPSPVLSTPGGPSPVLGSGNAAANGLTPARFRTSRTPAAAPATVVVSSTPRPMGVVGNPMQVPGSSGEGFSRHEVVVKQIGRHSDEVFKRMGSLMDAAEKEIVLCKDKADRLFRKLHDLESMMESRREFPLVLQQQQQNKNLIPGTPLVQ